MSEVGRSMASQTSTKVRRVRCPQCWKVLEEPPDISLYCCGGCGNILQAKNRKLESDRVELPSQEMHHVAKGQEGKVLEEKEARSSDQVSTKPPSLESSLDKDPINLDGDQVSNVVLCEGGGSAPNALSGLLEVTYPSKGSPMEDNEALEQDNLRGRFHDDNGEKPSSSPTGSSSGELTHLSESIKSLEQDRSHPHEHSKKGEESQEMLQGGDKLLNDIQDLESVVRSDSKHRDRNEINDVPPVTDEKLQNSSYYERQDSEGGAKRAGIDLSLVTFSHANDKTSCLAEQGIEAECTAAGFPNTTSLEKNMNAIGGNPTVTSQRYFNENLASCYLTCPEDECSPSQGSYNFGKVGDLSSELDCIQRFMPSCPTANAYYGYGGSESSYDGTDEQISVSTPSRKFMDIYRGTKTDSESERYYPSSSSHRAMRSSMWSRKDAEMTGCASDYNIRQDKEMSVSSLHSSTRDQLAGNRSFGPYSSQHNLLPPHPRLSLSRKAAYSEVNTKDLLRRVCELKDQLNRMHFPSAMRLRSFADGVVEVQSKPFNYDCLAAGHEMYEDINHPGTYLQHDRARGPGQYNISRMVLTEAAHHRHHSSCSCLHCCPPDWRYSGKLPMQFKYCQNGCCSVHGDDNGQHACSELLLSGYETNYDNMRLEEIKISRLQEKHRVAKRHILSMAGAAPFVACYRCKKLLQLPADFLIFKKKCHHLTCGACGKVLKFSLEQGNHIVPYIADASAPPPTEAGEYSRNLQWASDSGYRERGEVKPRSRQSFDGSESSKKTTESVGSSSRFLKWRKSISSIKELPLLSKPRLHHLMGYSSPRQVFD